MNRSTLTMGVMMLLFAAAGGPLLRIQLECPKCGGPFEIDDETRSVSCEHCGSLLLLEAPEREELYIAEGRVRGPQKEISQQLSAMPGVLAVHPEASRDGASSARFLIEADVDADILLLAGLD